MLHDKLPPRAVQNTNNNMRVQPFSGRPLWSRPCSWVRACCFGAF